MIRTLRSLETRCENVYAHDGRKQIFSRTTLHFAFLPLALPHDGGNQTGRMGYCSEWTQERTRRRPGGPVFHCELLSGPKGPDGPAGARVNQCLDWATLLLLSLHLNSLLLDVNHRG